MGGLKHGRIDEQLMVRDTLVGQAMRAAAASLGCRVGSRVMTGVWSRLQLLSPGTDIIASGLHDRNRRYTGEEPWYG